MNAVKQDFPRRILHIVAGMNTGGAETWLMHVLRCINRDQFHFDFFVHAATPSFYDDEIRSLGSRIITNPQPQFANIHGYSRNFLRTLKEFGPYDTVHSHVHHFSGVVLMLARIAGVPQRIAHSHTDLSLHEKNARFSRKMHWYIMKRLINMNATVGLGCSRVAAQNLFGDAWESDPRYQVLFCGIDMEPFKEPVNRNVVRCELNIPDDAFVIGHVGRFDGPKNHTFLIDIFFEVSKYEPKAVLLLVGDGPMRMDMEEKTVQLGLAGKVVFAGVRADVPRLLKGAMDILCFHLCMKACP
jgi:glycosyltransferase involved in cell wall biosynthesis